MRRVLFICFVLSFLPGLTSAQWPDLRPALEEVNAHWASREIPADNLPVEDKPNSDREWIQLHLLLVHQTLSAERVDHLSPGQQVQRQRGLDNLHRYAQRGVFPQNITHPHRQPVFIDHRGVHCAVGHLIAEGGHPKLSREIQQRMNYAYLPDMQYEPLEEWVDQSGFTAAELAWIQPGYPNPMDWKTMKGGCDGPVTSIIPNQSGNGLYIAGEFSMAGSASAPNLAEWHPMFAGYDWLSVANGSGVNGEVNDILYHQGKFYVAGYFYQIDTVITPDGLAMWDGQSWQPMGQFYVGALPNYVLDLEVYRDTIYAAGFFRNDFGAPEPIFSLAKWDGQQWIPASDDSVLLSLQTQEVANLHVHDGKLVVAGEFSLQDSVTIHNIFYLDGNKVKYFEEDLSLPVHDLATFENDLYVAGPVVRGSDTLGLARYDGQRWERVLPMQQMSYPDSSIVECLASTPFGLVMGGSFELQGFGLGYGQNIAAYMRSGHLYSLGVLDSAVHALYYRADSLYLGGDFTQALGFGGNINLGHIAMLDLRAALGQPELEVSEYNIYPNPARDIITLEWGQGRAAPELELVDMRGVAHPVSVQQQGTILQLEVRNLPRGSYILKSRGDDEIIRQRVSLH